jgi:ABC-type multidrug transport system ATPase subunit
VIRKQRRTAIVCSNDPTEARALADRVLFLEGGRLHADAPPERIEAELGL